MILLRKKSVLPGFSGTLGYAVLYLGIIVLIPLSTLIVKTSTLTWNQFWTTITAPRALASYRLSFLASFAGALVNAFFGVLVAWVLVRYRFPGKRLIDGLVDLPFALPTAVAGIALTALYSETGWIGKILHSFGIKAAYTPLGVTIALIFIGLPFVVRSVEPVLQSLDPEIEEAAVSLGANRMQTFGRVLIPELLPALLSGFVLAFARGLGEYGSVIFISGNMPMRTEITPLLIMIKLEQFNYAEASAIALVFLLASFALLLAVNVIQGYRTKAS
jgi:sulfate transport system permease protein